MILDTAANIGFGLAGAYGQKPKIAPWRRVSAQQAQATSVLGNVSNFGDIAKLGQLYNQNLLDQQNAMLPGYSANLASGEADTGQLLSDSSSLLKGQLPQDVIDQIERSDAFTSLSGGFAGSGMSRNLTARDLGLTSLDLMKQGAGMLGQGGNSAQQWASLANQDIMDPQSQFVTPQQQLQQTDLNELLRQQSLQNKYNVAAAPNPTLVGESGATGAALGQLTSGLGILGSKQDQQGGGGGGGTGILSLLGMFL